MAAHPSYFIVSHESPDVDGIGAELALHRILSFLGKPAVVLHAEALSDRYAFMDSASIIKVWDPELYGPALPEAGLIVVDTSDAFHMGRLGDILLPNVAAVFAIDHHEPARNASLSGLIDPTASSSCELALLLAESLGAALDPATARAAFAGMVFDTGSFVYPKTSARTFRLATALVEGGVVPFDVYQDIYESASIGALKLQQRVLASLELHSDTRVAIQALRPADLEAAGACIEDAETLINIPLRSKEIDVSILFKEGPGGSTRCSLRSRGNINVAAIAQDFGGGGHRTAAGFRCHQDLAQTKAEVLQKIAAQR